MHTGRGGIRMSVSFHPLGGFMFHLTLSDFYSGNLWEYYEFTHRYIGNFRDASLSDDRVPLIDDEGLYGGC